MVARAKSGTPLGTALVLMLLGLAVTTAGAWQLRLLDRTHQSIEMQYPASPRVLQAWILTLDRTAPESVDRLADRLLTMTLPQRRNVVLAMATREFFADLDVSGAGQRQLREMALNAVLSAVSRAPVQGELWFLAGRLHSQLFGPDARAQQYLHRSYLYAPREVDLVLARLEAMSLAWLLLTDESRNIVRQDMSLVEQAYPRRAEELRTYLVNAGAEL